jgi:hypothetical protein
MVHESVTTSIKEGIKNDQLTLDKGKRLLLNSFRFSQGSAELQAYIFAYLHDLHPNWKLSNDFANELLHISIEPAYQIVSSFTKNDMSGLFDLSHFTYKVHTPAVKDKKGVIHFIPKRDVNELLISQLRVMQVLFQDEYKHNRNDLVVLAMDAKLKRSELPCEKNIIMEITERMFGRDEYYRSKNRKKSYIVDHAMNRQTTGITEYDVMFCDVRDCIEQHINTWQEQLSLLTS